MRIRSLSVTIPVSSAESVSGVLAVPQGFAAGRTSAVIIAHGAGNDMHNPLLVHFSEGLCRAGHLNLRFNFPCSFSPAPGTPFVIWIVSAMS